jgi:hypothetical protein
MARCIGLIDRLLHAVRPVDDRDYTLDVLVMAEVGVDVVGLCRSWQLPGYPLG